jgi:paraquat-inducible protein B
MSVRAKPTLIGIFVCGAALLAVAAVLFFGDGKLFNHQEKFIIYFTDSVNGLSAGSAVKYKGVQIGQVSNIMIHYDQDENATDAIPVIISIDTTHLQRDLGEKDDLSNPTTFNGVIGAGLRARLQMQSFVTSQLYIELDYVDPPPPFTPISLSHTYKEIPSIPSGLSEAMQSVTTALSNLSKVDFADMANKIDHLADEITQSVDQLNLKEINSTVVTAGKNLNDILSDPKIKEALDKLGTTLDDLDHLATNLNGQVQPLAGEIQTTAKSAQDTLGEINQTLSSVRDLIAPDSSLRSELDKTLLEITNAARSLRVLSEFLEANPAAIITGKAPPANWPPLSPMAPKAAPVGADASGK